jgi:hypothetical protein
MKKYENSNQSISHHCLKIEYIDSKTSSNVCKKRFDLLSRTLMRVLNNKNKKLFPLYNEKIGQLR